MKKFKIYFNVYPIVFQKALHNAAILPAGIIIISFVYFLLSHKKKLAGFLIILASIILPFRLSLDMFRAGIYIYDIFFPILLVIMLHSIWRKPKFRFKGSNVLLFFMPLFTAGAISAINIKSLFRYIGYLYIWIQIPLTYIIFINLVKNKKQLFKVIYTLVFIGAIFSLYYILARLYALRYASEFLAATRVSKIYIQFGRGISIHQASPNQIICALYIVFAFFLSFAMLFYERKRLLRVILFLFMFFFLPALFITLSRVNIVLFVLYVPVLFYIYSISVNQTRDSNKKMFYAAALTVAIIYLILITYLAAGHNFLSRYVLGKGINSIYTRLYIYEKAFELFIQHPIAGVGIGNFFNYTGIIHAHNIILQVASEMGVIGLAGFAFFLYRIIPYIYNKIVSCNGTYRYITISASGCLIYFLIVNITDFTLGCGTGILLGTMIGIIDAAQKISVEV